jgi:hypothetical protein
LPLALALAFFWLLGVTQSRATSIAFDLRGLSTEDYRRIDGLGLERKVALRLVQEGFAVVASDREPDAIVRASVVPEGLELRANSGTSSLRLTVAMDGPAAEWQLEVAHKVSEMARTLALTKRVEPEPSSAPTHEAPPMPAPITSTRPRAPPAASVPEGSTRPEARWEVGLGAGVVVREGGSDPLVGVTAISSLGRLRLHLEVLGASSQGTGIEIWEGQGSAGVGFALVDGAVGVELGLAAGAVIQHFSLASRWATERAGTRASPAFWVPLYARWAASRHLVLSVRPAAGLSRSPAHASEGETLWSRGSVRLELVGALAWAF